MVAAMGSKLPASREEALTMLTNEVTSELAFRFPDRYLEDRLRSAVSSRLRGIRDWPETEETLVKIVNAGGLGLGAADVARVKASLEPRVTRIQTELYDRQKRQVLEALEKERESDKLREATRRVEDRSETDALFEEVTGKPASSLPVVEPGAVPPRVAPTPTPPMVAQPRVAPTPASRPAPPAPPVAASMADVRPPAKLVGPVEELRRLTVTDFRKLSSDPVEAAGKIEDKLKLLEEESLPRRFEGIAALKRSELFSIYWSVAQASLVQGLPVAAILDERRSEQLPVLTEKEFDAIMELNRRIRF